MIRAAGGLAIAVVLALQLGACGRSPPRGPVRTPEAAEAIAEHALSAAHLDEPIVSVDRAGGAWMVITRWRETSMAGHLVTVDASSGKVRMERYRMLQMDRLS